MVKRTKRCGRKNKNEVKKIKEKMSEEEGLRYFHYIW